MASHNREVSKPAIVLLYTGLEHQREDWEEGGWMVLTRGQILSWPRGGVGASTITRTRQIKITPPNVRESK